MSELPNDLREWPADPYELLGVDYYVDERTARKAYLRLVRRFKPDFHPDHFQRIREAYESVLAQSSYQAAIQDDDGTRTLVFNARDTWEPRQDHSSHSIHDEAWEDAVAGRERDAYAKLVRLYECGESLPDACLRLYWLLQAAPELDASASPCHWLVEGLCATRLTGPMHDLYEREIATSPEEAASSRCAKLLAVEAEPGRLYDFIQTRWRACDRLGDFSRISADLELLKERFAYQQESIWYRLLLLAASHLAWGDEDAVGHFEHIQQTLAQSRYSHHELDYELDRLDLLIEITERIGQLRFVVDIPLSFAELIEQSWTQSYEVYEPILERVVSAIASDPARGMRQIDHLKRVNQAAAAYLVQLILSHQWTGYDNDETASQRAEVAATRFVYGLKQPDYDAARRALLQVAVAEATSPELLAHFADELLGSRTGEVGWTTAANADLGMLGAYHAYRLVFG